MGYCQGKGKATVSYTKENGAKENYSTTSTPIEVKTTQGIGTKRWRFYGTGDDGLAYQLIAEGVTPSYILNSGFNSRGYTPAMDGVRLREQTYYYVSGYGIEELAVISGTRCQIEITKADGTKHTDFIKCPGTFKVACDSECPPHHLRCLTSHYPGYCCIPCSAIASQINSIVARL